MRFAKELNLPLRFEMAVVRALVRDRPRAKHRGWLVSPCRIGRSSAFV